MPIAVAHRMAFCGTVPAAASIHRDVVGLASNPGPDVGCKARIVVGVLSAHEERQPHQSGHSCVLQPCGPESRPSRAAALNRNVICRSHKAIGSPLPNVEELRNADGVGVCPEMTVSIVRTLGRV